MSNLRGAICRPRSRILLSSFMYCGSSGRRASAARLGFSSVNNHRLHTNNNNTHVSPSSLLSSPPWITLSYFPNIDTLHHSQNSRRTSIVRASKWTDEKSPYQTLELERDADDEKIKFAYRRLAKFYHPDVYNGRGTLEEGETAESRFIKIQAAYELLIDEEKRRQYDTEHRVNPMKASEAWMEWLLKKRKAFYQRGDMAIAAWAEQQQRELNIRARRLSRSKVDPEEEKRILAKEKKASMEYYSNTLRIHTLVLKKRDLTRKKKAEEEKRKAISQLLAAEGLELDTDDDDDDDSKSV